MALSRVDWCPYKKTRDTIVSYTRKAWLWEGARGRQPAKEKISEATSPATPGPWT